MESTGEVIYEPGDGNNHLEVKLENDTLWLTQKQIADLVKVEVPAINKHIINIYQGRKLIKEATISKMEIVRQEGVRKVKRSIETYNLDVVIYVGYRVNSYKSTQFRIWATQTLKKHLVKGYTINEKRLKEQQAKFEELYNTVTILKEALGAKHLSGNETQGLLEIISSYTRSFILLNQFDNNSLEQDFPGKPLSQEIGIEEALIAIQQLKEKLITKGEASDLFGRQREDTFNGILNSVVQTFGGQYLYPSIEEQAAHPLYFVIKNHPFADGNKPIGTFLFVWFLHLNSHLLRSNNEAKINDNALAALALLIAQSDPANKNLMLRLVINMVNE
ncbi:MAG: Fic/DOC family protein [Flaviaesturariibacter sp.]|nr:Fic/DOC family protein [Flaviaesturariibacter sp.]